MQNYCCTQTFWVIKSLWENLSKIPRVMKFYILLLICSVSLVQATNSYAQTALVNLEIRDQSVKKVLDEIENQSEYSFFFNNKHVNLDRKVSVSVRKSDISSVLKQIFAETNITYTVLDKKIVLSVESSILKQTKESKKVTGVIKDHVGEPIIGANVVEKGTTNGTITDFDGKFSLDVADNALLVVTYIGYNKQEVSTEGKNTIQITLKEDSQLLDEVVVVGYGVQKKVNLTGAVSTVKYGSELENRPITDPSQALAGKTTGVWVSQNSGAPGSDAATIRVRGYGTLNNTNPLVLIDGVEGRMEQLNPSDIASITVLKDAASAAIYGSRAANGVILIETKKGEGDKVAINYNGYFGVQQLARRYELISNSAEYMQMWNTANKNSGSDPLFPDDVIEGFAKGNDPYRYPNTNYLDEVFHNAFTTQHNLSATVGGNKSNSYIGIGYLKNNGIIRNTDSERINLTFTNETKVTDWFKLGGTARLMRSVANQPYNGIGRAFYIMSNGGFPFSTPYLQDGKTFGGSQALYVSGPKAGQPITDTRNPFPDLYNGNDETTNHFMKGNVYATLTLLKGLTASAQYSGQYNNNSRDKYNQKLYCYTDLEGSNKSWVLGFPTTLTIYRGVTSEYYSTFFANVNYNHTFNKKHEVTALLGYQQEALSRKVSTAQSTDPAKDNLHQVSSGTKNPSVTGNEYRWRMLSYFGRVNYAFNERYLAEVNLRADASSRFARGNRWGYFPSFSAGWRLNEESFVKDLNIFDNLKLRASWGKLGNQNIGEASNSDYFPYLTVLTQDYSNSYNYNNTLAPGAAVTSLSDPRITWETTATTNIGLDLGFLNNRLSIEADYFERKTTDIIVRLPISGTLGGLSAPYENVGEMNNKGFELNLSWQDKISESDFSYSIGGNLTYVNNKVVKFRKDAPDQLYLIREGYSYKTLYGYTFDGIYQTDKEATQHMHSNGYLPKAGDIKYKDLNGDGKLNYEDKQELGNTIPKFTYGINASLNWKNFDLNMQFTGIAGVTGYMQNDWTRPLAVSGGQITERWRDAWSSSNPSNTTPIIKMNDTWNRQESSFWTCNMSWFKLKNIQLGYNVPKNLTNKLKLQKLYVYMNATDLFTLVSNSYEGFDPEQDTFSSKNDRYPIPRIFSFGLNVSF